MHIRPKYSDDSDFCSVSRLPFRDELILKIVWEVFCLLSPCRHSRSRGPQFFTYLVVLRMLALSNNSRRLDGAIIQFLLDSRRNGQERAGPRPCLSRGRWVKVPSVKRMALPTWRLYAVAASSLHLHKPNLTSLGFAVVNIDRHVLMPSSRKIAKAATGSRLGSAGRRLPLEQSQGEWFTAVSGVTIKVKSTATGFSQEFSSGALQASTKRPLAR